MEGYRSSQHFSHWMVEMRIKHNFGLRTGVTREEKKKLFLVFEGMKTEQIYFEALIQKRNYSASPFLFELVILDRVGQEMGCSNPLAIVKLLQKQANEEHKDCYSLETIINRVLGDECLPQNKIDTLKKAIHSQIPNISEQLSKQELKRILPKIQNVLKDNNISLRIELTVSRLIDEQNMGYDKDRKDCLCCIFDRDKKSFKDSQYDKVVRLCNEEGYCLFITNPCFEFWLYLHLPKENLTSIKESELLENRRMSSNGPTYIESHLKSKLFELDPPISFNKNKYKPDYFINNIPNAMKNATNYAQKIDELKTAVGSNLASLMEKIGLA